MPVIIIAIDRRLSDSLGLNYPGRLLHKCLNVHFCGEIGLLNNYGWACPGVGDTGRGRRNYLGRVEVREASGEN
jgi:hypothetical protein